MSGIAERSDENGSSMRAAIGLLVVLVIVVIIYHATKPSQRRGAVSAGLQKNGWILYTRPGCGYCDKQKALLGGRFLNGSGNVIDCDPQNTPTTIQSARGNIPQCGDSRIVGYPFWFSTKTGGIKIGLQDMGELKRMAGTRSS